MSQSLYIACLYYSKCLNLVDFSHGHKKYEHYFDNLTSHFFLVHGTASLTCVHQQGCTDLRKSVVLKERNYLSSPLILLNTTF